MKTIKYNDNFYYSTFDPETDKPTLGYYKGKDKSVLLDAGNSKRHIESFLNDLNIIGLPYPDFVLITHSHWDHTFGLCSLDIPSYALDKTINKLKIMSNYKWDKDSLYKRVESNEESLFSYRNILKQYPNLDEIKVCIPTNEVKGKIDFDLGDRKIEMYHVLSPHDDDCAIFYMPSDKLLFLGDAYCSVPFGEDWIYDKDLLKVFIDHLKIYPLDTVCIKGHHNPSSIKDLIDELETYL